MTLTHHQLPGDRRSGQDRRRSSLRVTGPHGLRIVLVGSGAIIWGLAGLIAGLLVCIWSHG